MHRFFEILPGTLSWLTLFLVIFLSWYWPQFVAVFIIFFDIYWVLKTLYLSLHLRSTFSIMKNNLKVNWFARLKEEFPKDWDKIMHLVILPMYREPYDVVRESFESLAKGNYPLEKFIVVLATEEKAGDAAAETARKIENEFGSKFFRFLVTSHPANLPGEIPGKGSNETWAAKQAKKLIIDPLVNTQINADKTLIKTDNIGMNQHGNLHKSALSYENILVSVFDVDTQIFPEYFGRLGYVFLKSENRLRAIYQPIPLFINNVYQAPALARVISFSSTFWQMMQQSRPERLTSFSSQSIPFTALLDIGYWHTDVVSEDSRSFWQCYLRYHGDFRVEPLFYPVSMDANAAPTFWGTLKNNYRQHRRWAWGCENIPYLMCGKSDPNLRIHPNAPKTNSPQIVEKELSYKLTGIFFEVQKKLGRYARERQYGDELAIKLKQNGLMFKREKPAEVGGRKSNFMDFVVENKVAIELKAKAFIQKEDYYQVQRYLQSSNLELGLIVNFAQPFLKPKRVLNSAMYSPQTNSEHSDEFVVSDRKEGFLYDSQIPLWKKWYWSFNSIEGFHSWATNALMIFALGWLPVILGGKHFNVSLLSYNLPSITRLIVEISMVGVASAAFFSIILLPPRPEPLKWHQYIWYIVQWLLLPLTLIVFGCFPALEAQTRLMLGGKWRLGFWVTPKTRVGSK